MATKVEFFILVCISFLVPRHFLVSYRFDTHPLAHKLYKNLGMDEVCEWRVTDGVRGYT